MRPLLRKLRSLPAADRRLLVRAAAAVAGFRLALWLLPFRIVARIRPSPGPGAPGPGDPAPERIAGYVRAAGRRVPRASCLTRALAARWLLERAGHAPTLHFGWRKEADGSFHAHAWLESGARVLLGGEEDLTLYQRFPARLPGRRQAT